MTRSFCTRLSWNISLGSAFRLTKTRKDLQVAQVVGDAPSLVVEPNGPSTQHEFVFIVTAPNCGILCLLLGLVPELDVRVAPLALEVLAALVADFERALKRRFDDVRCQGFPK